ncbi:hypothetical protein ThidrDRAFT_3926 [Thiorhodococcus drewsii AZ1]|uniref:Uncharacterized protein n=1 Tax=Thiorhodococcus drewsii AZ1 TaxID=765913 RepID=G2E6L3_9GAMM|nr:hypothetical protein [Thiorhodococcus drewsii]EGV28297.1 hypothetical protein ThidrDRAFT_3926 [Thiorhodococcus drewsii AZ1]
MYIDPSDWPAPIGPQGTAQASSPESLRVEITLDLVQQLIEEGRIGAADLHCLDAGSKQRLQRACLDNCARDLSYRAQFEHALV